MEDGNISEDTTLRVMSYNIQGVPDKYHPLVSLHERFEALVQFIRDMVKKYDVEILILEEVFDERLYRRLVIELEDDLKYKTKVLSKKKVDKEWNTHVNTSRGLFHLLNGGVCIFSKFPIEEQHALIFRNHVATCGLIGKGAVLAVINKNGKFVSVIGTHLQAGSNACRMFIRQKQFKQTMEWLNDLFSGKLRAKKPYAVSKDFPIVMGGDFNLCLVKDAKYYNGMLKHGKDQNIEFKTTFLSETPDITYGTVNDFCKMQTYCSYGHVYDYIFVSQNVKVVEEQKAIEDKLQEPLILKKSKFFCFGPGQYEVYNVSDHFPVFSVVSL